MQGFHMVKVFRVLEGVAEREECLLPDGWKPFSSYVSNGVLYIVCRKWHRS